MGRDTSIDGVKGVAIILMVYGHVTQVGAAAGFQKDAVSWIYTFHMPIFLMLSGYFFGTSVDVLDAFRKMFRKLLVPYIIFVSLYLLGLFFASGAGAKTNNAPPASLVDALYVVLLRPRGAYWFIHSLLVMQGAFLLGRYVQKFTSWGEADLWILYVAVLSLLTISGVLRTDVAFFFCGGMLMRKALSGLPGSVILGGMLCAAVIVGNADGEFMTGISPYRVVWCFGVLALLIGAFSRNAVPARGFFSWVGRNTMPILLLHALFLVALKSASFFFVSIDGSGALNAFISTLGATLGSVMCAWIFDRVGLSAVLFGTPALYSRWRPLS